MEDYSSIETKKLHTNQEMNKLKLSIYAVLVILTVLSLLLLFANLTIACMTNFTCSRFIPSPGYLGCFRGHDRVFISACTLLSFTLSIFYTCTFINFSTRFSELKKNTFIILSFLSSLSLPILSLSDEVIAVHYLPLDIIYRLASSTFVISSLILLVLILQELEVHSVSLTQSEKKWYFILKLQSILLFSLLVFDLLQWKYANSDFKGPIFNDNMQSKVEWVILFLALILPAFISKFFRESTMTIELKINQSLQEIELSQISIEKIVS